MPTGYTHPVVEGKITKFSDFAMSCARAFGALITMREDALDAPIPEEIKPSDYHAKELQKATAALAKALKMTAGQMANDATRANEKAAEVAREISLSYATQNARLEKMLAATKAWRPPTPDHNGMKEFMIQQLTDSMHSSDLVREYKKLSGQEWHAAEIKRLEHDIKYHTRENNAEIERARDRTEWIKKLRASLGA